MPKTCPDHVSRILYPEGSKLMLESHFLAVIHILSHEPEGSVVELQHREEHKLVVGNEEQSKENWCTDSAATVSVVLTRGGYLACRSSLEASSHLLPTVASTTTCVHCKQGCLYLPTSRGLI